MIKDIPKHQSVVRDLNISVNESTPYGDVEKKLKNVGVESFSLIDLFIKDGKKVFTIRIVFDNIQEAKSMLSKIND